MKQSEAMTGARGQIAWILALIMSTAAIIYLERLDLGAPASLVASSTGLAAQATGAVTAAEDRYRAAPDPASAAALALALVAAVQAGALDPAEGRARLAPLRTEAALSPEGAAIAVLARLTFGD